MNLYIYPSLLSQLSPELTILANLTLNTFLKYQSQIVKSFNSLSFSQIPLINHCFPLLITSK